jgi:adenylate cyclase
LPTPVSDEMRGLDLHAAFADQIIGAALGKWPATVRTFSDSFEMLSVIACALIGFGIGILSKRVILAGGLALVLSAAILFSGKLFLANYTWLPVVSPALAMLIGFGCAAMASWAVEKFALSQARGLMLALLGKEQIGLVWGEREQLLSSGKISAQPSYATIMMTDLKGYTAATEKLGRDGVLPWLNRYMDRMSQIVKEHDGFVKSYIGDAIYAVFGLGKLGDEAGEPARQAILCTLEMREALVALNKEFEQEDLPEAAMRVGLCSGDLSYGTMGSHGAMEYAIMGDTVNIAARLEAYDKELAADELCRTIVSCTTLELAGADGFESEEVGQLALKGKTNKIAAHRIISATTT